VPGPQERRWLRPLGLFAVAMALSMGQPSLVALVAFGFLTLLFPGPGFFPILATASALGLAFIGATGQAYFYLDRGWAILVGGWFVLMLMMWPSGSFLTLALIAVVGALASAGILLSSMGGVGAAEAVVAARVSSEVQATLAMTETLSARMGTGAAAELFRSSAEAQAAVLPALGEIRVLLFPALIGLSALASLGVAWWMHRRITTGLRDGLGGIREFRFPDPLIWVMIVGILLMLTGEWGVGSGRLGANLVAFMGGLYIFRGAGVLLSLVGSLSLLGGFALLVGVVFASPFLLATAMMVGLSDSWFDLRARFSGRGDGGAG